MADTLNLTIPLPGGSNAQAPTPQMDTPFARLSQALADHRLSLTSTALAAQDAALQRVECLVHLERERIRQARHEAGLSDVLCCECGELIPKDAAYQRLKLCVFCMCAGLLVHCRACGENYPEHHSGGRGCAAFVHPDDKDASPE